MGRPALGSWIVFGVADARTFKTKWKDAKPVGGVKAVKKLIPRVEQEKTYESKEKDLTSIIPS